MNGTVKHAKLGGSVEVSALDVADEACGATMVQRYNVLLNHNSIYDWQQVVLPASPSPAASTNGSQNNPHPCNEATLDCPPPLAVHTGNGWSLCGPGFALPDPDGDGCPDATTDQQGHAGLDASAAGTTASNVPMPNHLHTLRFGDGRQRVVLDGELPLAGGCVEVVHTLSVTGTGDVVSVRLPGGGVGNVTVTNLLQLRAAGPQAAPLQAGPADPGTPQPGQPTHTAGDGGLPRFAFFVHDHLGSTRVLYSNKLEGCGTAQARYVLEHVLEHVLDYYPYGRTLREHAVQWERYQTTHHERDPETGLDYRGARFYDGDVPRFLSCDLLAYIAHAWTPYRYGFDNPLLFTDPSGKFESKKEAKEYAKENGIKTGWFSRNKIVSQSDGTFSIENERENSFIQDFGSDFGVLKGALVVGGKESAAFTRSVGFNGALLGGIGFELGYAQDNHSNSGVYIRVSAESGFGGGINLFSAQELVPNEGETILLKDIEGKDVAYNLGVGPIGLSYGGNQSVRKAGLKAYTEFADKYTVGGFSGGPDLRDVKLRTKLSGGFTASHGTTTFLHKNKLRK